MSRTAEGLESAIGKIRELREEFWQTPDSSRLRRDFNQQLEGAGRVADFMELGPNLCASMLSRAMKVAAVTSRGISDRRRRSFARRRSFSYVAAWGWNVLARRLLSRRNISISTMFIQANVVISKYGAHEITLYVWRQKNASTKGKMVRYDAPDVSPDMSFLEMLDVVNEA